MNEKNEILKELITIRRHLHKNPEIGFETAETKKYIKEKLAEIKFDTTKITMTIHEIQHSLIVIVTNNQGRVLGLRADIDALELKEENTFNYKSKNNYMHACGHDAHTAILLVTISQILKEPHLINGTIKFIFQTAEEGPDDGGAYYLAQHEIIKNLDEIYALHVNSELETGTIALKAGPMMAESNAFKIELFGKSAHIASYHNGKDALKIGTSIVTKIDSIKTTDISPNIPCVIAIGSFQSGTSPNIISNYTKIEGTIRTFDKQTKETIIERIKNIVKTNCADNNINYEIKFNAGYPPIINNPELVEQITKIAKTIPIKGKIIQDHLFICDDFSRYLEHIKGVYYFLGTKKDFPIPLHSSKFDLDEQAMYLGYLMHMKTITHFFNKKDFV